jgi:hypothetical protein
MIFAMLSTELPPRGLDGVNEDSAVEQARTAVQAAFNLPADKQFVLRHGEVELSDTDALLSSYGIKRDALLSAVLS